MRYIYLEKLNQPSLNYQILTGILHLYLANFNEQTQERYQLIVRQMATAEGVNADLKR